MHKLFPPLKNLNLPNVITTISIFTSFLCIIILKSNNLRLALSLYAITVVCDRIDGITARRLGLTSDFGKELDSLADSFSFCIMPAVFACFIGFTAVYQIAIMCFYIFAGVWRLAHFNLEGMDNSAGKECFIGIPTTIVGSWFLIIVSVLHVALNICINFILTPFFIISALLMLSSISYEKNGLLTKTLYLLLPAAVALQWIFV